MRGENDMTSSLHAVASQKIMEKKITFPIDILGTIRRFISASQKIHISDGDPLISFGSLMQLSNLSAVSIFGRTRNVLPKSTCRSMFVKQTSLWRALRRRPFDLQFSWLFHLLVLSFFHSALDSFGSFCCHAVTKIYKKNKKNKKKNKKRCRKEAGRPCVSFWTVDFLDNFSFIFRKHTAHCMICFLKESFEVLGSFNFFMASFKLWCWPFFVIIFYVWELIRFIRLPLDIEEPSKDVSCLLNLASFCSRF